MVLEGLDELYRNAILEHSRNPRNQESVTNPDINSDGINPFCGDEVQLQIRLDDTKRVVCVGLQIEGCSINRATGSMLSEAILGKNLVEIDRLTTAFNNMMRDTEAHTHDQVNLGDLTALSGVKAFPVRVKCALLPWSTLHDGVTKYRGRLIL